MAESPANNKPTSTERALNNKLGVFKTSDPRVFNTVEINEACSQTTCLPVKSLVGVHQRVVVNKPPCIVVSKVLLGRR